MKKAMKKLWLILLCAMCTVACADDDSDAQQVTCNIVAPEDGVEINLVDKLMIEGQGHVTVGRITRVTLTVGGEAVPEVVAVPFVVEYVFPQNQTEGMVKIVLTVESDTGIRASSEVTVMAYRKERPAAPEPGTMTDTRDGNVYKTVKLGDQVWMAENLRYLPEQHNDVSNTEMRYYVWSDYDAKSEIGTEALKAYGAFYNWPAALQGEAPCVSDDQTPIRGVCPEGWHIPSQAEWTQLSRYVLEAGFAAIGNDGVADETALAKALASTSLWQLPAFIEGDPQPTWVGVEPERNNATLFNGIPIGFRSYSVGEGGVLWDHAAYSAGWWSSTQGTMGEGFASVVRMWSDNQRFITEGSDFIAGVGLPVRCLKD